MKKLRIEVIQKFTGYYQGGINLNNNYVQFKEIKTLKGLISEIKKINKKSLKEIKKNGTVTKLSIELPLK